MPRRIRQWWRAAIAAAAIMSPHAGAAAPDVVSNLFDLESGAQIGLEYRVGFVPIDLSVLVSVEGANNNVSDSKSGSLNLRP
jgi:hypothetical protein